MSKCDLCGQDAGFLRKRHKECDARYKEGTLKISVLAQEAALAKLPLDSLRSQTTEIAKTSYIQDTQLSSLYVTGFEQAVDAVLEDSNLSEEEEDHLQTFREEMGLSQDEVDRAGAYTRLVKGAVIRDVLEGDLHERVKLGGDIPFNFQKNEKLVWLFQQVNYSELRTTTKYQGSYQGVSLRVAKGVYYRTGGFRGNPVPVTKTVPVDIGLLGITNKHIYFAGSIKSFRVAYLKIVTFTPYSDGIAIQRDASSAKPQIFITGDGWFTYNLVSNLAQSLVA
jgi:hypothetical protein